MSNKNKKLKRATAPKSAKPVKASPAPNPNKTERKKYTWCERILVRVERAESQASLVKAMIESGKPPGFTDLEALSLKDAIDTLGAVKAQLAALPGDFKPKRASQGSRSGVAIGTKVGVTDEGLKDPIFKHISADLYENAIVVDADGKQNWLVKCVDGVMRTIRKALLEPIDDDATDDDVEEVDEILDGDGVDDSDDEAA